MASISAGNQYTQSYSGGYIAKRARTDALEEEKAKKAAEQEAAKSTPELEAYKEEFLKKIKERVEKKSELERTSINLDITNDAYEKMRTDTNYEKKILDLFDAKADKKYPLPPVSITLAANETGEDASIDYGQGGELFEKRALLGGMQKAMLRNNAQSMRSEVLSTLQTRLNGGTAQTDLSSLSAYKTSTGNYDFYA